MTHADVMPILISTSRCDVKTGARRLPSATRHADVSMIAHRHTSTILKSLPSAMGEASARQAGICRRHFHARRAYSINNSGASMLMPGTWIRSPSCRFDYAGMAIHAQCHLLPRHTAILRPMNSTQFHHAGLFHIFQYSHVHAYFSLCCDGLLIDCGQEETLGALRLPYYPKAE